MNVVENIHDAFFVTRVAHVGYARHYSELSYIQISFWWKSDKERRTKSRQSTLSCTTSNKRTAFTLFTTGEEAVPVLQRSSESNVVR